MSHTNEILLSLLVFFLTGIFTAYYASRKGRNPFLWFVLGFVFGIIAPIILLFFPSVKEERNENGYPTMTVSPPDPAIHHSLQEQPTLAAQKRQEEEDKLWYYLDQNHQQMGPVSVIALRELWNRGKLELNNYVWSEGMEQWEKVDNLPDLKEALNRAV